jgi:hypothetical protein
VGLIFFLLYGQKGIPNIYSCSSWPRAVAHMFLLILHLNKKNVFRYTLRVGVRVESGVNVDRCGFECGVAVDISVGVGVGWVGRICTLSYPRKHPQHSTFLFSKLLSFDMFTFHHFSFRHFCLWQFYFRHFYFRCFYFRHYYFRYFYRSTFLCFDIFTFDQSRVNPDHQSNQANRQSQDEMNNL